MFFVMLFEKLEDIKDSINLMLVYTCNLLLFVHYKGKLFRMTEIIVYAE